MTTFYKKVGRKYVPVAEYDRELTNSYEYGATLVTCVRGMTSRRDKIDPAFAPMIAAGEFAKDAISTVLMNASDLKPTKVPITEEQREAWENLTQAFGEEMHMLQWPSFREAVDAGVDAMRREANITLENPAVKKAYDQFMLIYKLTKETNDT